MYATKNDVEVVGPYCATKNWSAAWPRGSERRFYDCHNRKVDGLTPTLASLLRPWIIGWSEKTFLKLEVGGRLKTWQTT